MATEVPSSVLTRSHEDHGPAILAVSLLTTIAAVICVSLIYIRLRLTRSFWWDDGFIAAAAVRPRSFFQH